MFENLHFDFSNKSFLLILGAYGIVQVLAQDLGIKTGKRQRDLVQSMPVQIILLYAGAYTVTENYTNALIATSLYYLLKYVYSGGKTSNVCFESV
tara:strand:+ start:196 stop:480 length:285 start_codon:yes stop_codon:yes gene_type:complete